MQEMSHSKVLRIKIALFIIFCNEFTAIVFISHTFLLSNLPPSLSLQPVLVIGAHKLEGVMVTLPKPFLIMRKRKLPCKGTLTQGKGKRRMSGGSEGAGEETTTPKGKSSNSAGVHS